MGPPAGRVITSGLQGISDCLRGAQVKILAVNEEGQGAQYSPEVVLRGEISKRKQIGSVVEGKLWKEREELYGGRGRQE